MKRPGAASRCAILVAVLTAVAIAPRALGQLSVPAYSSLSGAAKTLFLDFDGDFTPVFGPYTNINTPPYDIDGDETSFSNFELINMQKIWSGVSEKYSPFNINVTTVDPGNRATGVTMAVNIGGTSAWVGQLAGGIGSINGFTAGNTTAFVFPKHLGNGTPKYVTEAAAHEAGHAFGLRHQSTYDPEHGGKIEEYNSNGGTSLSQPTDRAPIMGLSYFATRGQWWHGTSSVSRFSIQDDMALIARTGPFTNNFGYRPDDYAVPAMLTVGGDHSIRARGVIENIDDVDELLFSFGGGIVELFADVNLDTPMLDLSLELFDVDDNLVASSVTASLGEHLRLTLDEGDYRIAVSSAGNYGDVGQWIFTGFLAPEPSSTLAMLALSALMMRRRRASGRFYGKPQSPYSL